MAGKSSISFVSVQKPTANTPILHARSRQAHREPKIRAVRAREVRGPLRNRTDRPHQPEARRQTTHAPALKIFLARAPRPSNTSGRSDRAEWMAPAPGVILRASGLPRWE